MTFPCMPWSGLPCVIVAKFPMKILGKFTLNVSIHYCTQFKFSFNESRNFVKHAICKQFVLFLKAGMSNFLSLWVFLHLILFFALQWYVCPVCRQQLQLIGIITLNIVEKYAQWSVWIKETYQNTVVYVELRIFYDQFAF